MVQIFVHKVENNKEFGQINLYAAKAGQKVKHCIQVHMLIQQQFKEANNVSIKQFNNTI